MARSSDSTPWPNEAPDDMDTRSLDSVVRAMRHPSPRWPDHRVVGYEDVGQEHFVEHGGTGELAQRSDVDALRVHVHNEVGDAGVLRRAGFGAGEADSEIGRLGQ